MKLNDRTGQRYGNLVVIERVPRPQYRAGTHAFWKCRCDCGKETIVCASSLGSGQTKSCGCKEKLQAQVNLCLMRRKRKGMTECKLDKVGEVDNTTLYNLTIDGTTYKELDLQTVLDVLRNMEFRDDD